jgi:hypothetical protein
LAYRKDSSRSLHFSKRRPCVFSNARILPKNFPAGVLLAGKPAPPPVLVTQTQNQFRRARRRNGGMKNENHERH